LIVAGESATLPAHLLHRLMRLAALASLVLLVAACDSADDDAVRITLRAGEMRRYEVAYATDTTGGGRGTLPTVVRTDRVVGVGQALDSLRGLTVVESTEANPYDPTGTSQTRMWYRPSADRLEEVAYEFVSESVGTFGLRSARPGELDPSLPLLVRQAVAARGTARPGGGGVVRGPQARTPARIVLEYPAEAGRVWTHFEVDSFFRSTREVVGMETVQTPAGTFRCVVVRTHLIFGGAPDDSIDWVDWIAAAGLVQRRIVYRDQILTDEQGNEIARVTTTQTDRLAAAE
jgi:hypothetical protein